MLEEISLTAASQAPSGLEYPDLPWQISRHAVGKLATGRAYTSGRALVVTSDPGTSGPIRVHALSSAASGRMDWKALRETFSAVLRLHSDREFFSPAVFPEDFAEEIFAPLGFQREPLSNF